MAKMLVETKDNLQVVGNGDEHHARHNRPSVVRATRFMSSHVSEGNIKMLAQLNDEASDKEFAAHYAEADTDEKRADVVTEYAKAYAPGSEKPAKPEKQPAPKPDDKK